MPAKLKRKDLYMCLCATPCFHVHATWTACYICHVKFHETMQYSSRNRLGDNTEFKTFNEQYSIMYDKRPRIWKEKKNKKNLKQYAITNKFKRWMHGKQELHKAGHIPSRVSTSAFLWTHRGLPFLIINLYDKYQIDQEIWSAEFLQELWIPSDVELWPLYPEISSVLSLSRTKLHMKYQIKEAKNIACRMFTNFY